MKQPKTWFIGADSSCEIVIDQPTVSGQHCRLMRADDGFVLEDLQSHNGTFVNGVRITQPTRVTSADRITLGKNVAMPWPEPGGNAVADGQAAPPRAKQAARDHSIEAPAEQQGATCFVVADDGSPRAGEGRDENRSIRIGRLPDNDVVLDNPVVSSHHARIEFDQGQAWIEDCSSRNGTAIGSPQRKITRARLAPDDVVYFGTLRVPAARLFAGEPAVVGRQTSLKIAQRVMLIGRAAGCDLVLDHPRVSRRHAQLLQSPEQVTIEDLGSTHGTFVNGERITTVRPLRPGDLVAISKFTFRLTADGQLEQRDFRGNVTIEARGISIEVPGRRLLEDVSLTVYPSELVALMGPSGAGKTTLLNALNGYAPPTTGRVLFNARDLYAHYAEFQGVVGYVPQDDIMHRDLTVAQALEYTARLRLPADFSGDEIRKRIQEVIGQLGLEGTENVLIGSPEKRGISGGQRKRVNLAMELLTGPSVLFLDEPTSGLSSEDTLMVMKLLRKLADGGKTIIVTIHQPSLEAYRLLDNLILVAKDARSTEPGRLVFYGPAYPQAIDFFNPDGIAGLKPGAEPSPDEVLRGLAKDQAAVWRDRYVASPLKQQYVDARAGKQPVESSPTAQRHVHRLFGFSQWWTLVRRCLAIKLRDAANSTVLLAQAPIIALLVVLVFGKRAAESATAENWQSVANATSITVFLLGLAALWFGCSNAAREIVGEWAIYHRERMVNLKIPSYVGSKFTVLGGLCLLQCTVLLGIVHWGAGLHGPWLPMLSLLVLASLVGLGIGLTVSSLARSSEVAIALLPLILLPMVILAGILQPIHEMNLPAQGLAHLMPSRWAFEGLLLLETEDRPRWRPPLVVQLTPTSAAQTKEQDMAEHYFPVENKRTGTVASGIALTGMLVLLAVAIHLILVCRDVH